MKFLFDFIPFIIFFIAYKNYDFYVATAALIIASVSQLGLYWLCYRRVEKMQVFSTLLVGLFGGASLILHNEDFLKWKTSIFSFLTAGILFASHYLGKQVALQRLLNHLQLPETLYRFWNMAWVVFLTLMGILNLIIAYSFSTKIWIHFKMFGFLGLTLIFSIIQAIAFAKYLPRTAHPTDRDQHDHHLKP